MNAKQTPNLAVDDIPEPGECSPLYYMAMNPAQRAEHDAKVRKAEFKRRVNELSDFGLIVLEVYMRYLSLCDWLQSIPARWVMWTTRKGGAR